LLLAWDSRLSLDFFDSGLHTYTAVARLTLALAKLSCCYLVVTFVTYVRRNQLFSYVLNVVSFLLSVKIAAYSIELPNEKIKITCVQGKFIPVSVKADKAFDEKL